MEQKPLQKELVLYALMKAGDKGVTILGLTTIYYEGRRYRIGDPRARVRDLRVDGHNIDTEYRDADGKFHPWGLYFLREKE